MRYPIGLVLDSARHLASKKLRGERKFPLVLSLEPLGNCVSTVLANGQGNGVSGAAGPTLSIEQSLAAVDECRTPIVSITGSEPLDYPEIGALTRAILDRRRHLFLCTDGTRIRRHLHLIPPYTNFFWNVRLNGTESVHDARAHRTGLFSEALDGIKAAKNAGFFVLVSSVIHPDTDISDLAALYERLHAVHVDGYVLSPHYPEQKLCRDGSARFKEKMHQRFQEAGELLSDYNLLSSPIYLEYLRGERELDCSVWGGPVYGPQGWSSPCRLLAIGYAQSYQQLLENTVWENYGRGLNPRCENCQCPEGYETAALLGMNPKAGDLWKILKWQLGGSLGEKREGKRKA
jgi:hopanoid biosynthesis associated radical SAM protein HpnH